MRAAFTVFALSCTMAMAYAQSAPPAASEPTGTLQQVMQGERWELLSLLGTRIWGSLVK